jgi:parallel beta-helix repeat protein
MKTLQQIEPRIDLQNAPTSAVTTTDANYHFIITQAGSYYLSANLGVTKPSGILINVAGVTLDLNGFEISRASGSGGIGIEISTTSHRAAVRNGSIRGFATGILDDAHGCSFRDLRVGGCTNIGIIAASGAVLESCHAHNNSGTSGISAGRGSVLTNCSADNNTATFAIFTDFGSTLHNCTASDNTGGIRTGPGSSLSNCTAQNNQSTYGISAGAGSSLTNCSAVFNTSSASRSAGIVTAERCTLIGCTSTSNSSSAPGSAETGMGFDLGHYNNVQKCTAGTNRGHGFLAGFGGRISDCHSSENGLSNTGSGISTLVRAVVSRCTANTNRTSGIVVQGGSIVSECTANSNGTGAGAGIDSSGGSGTRIEANQARDNAGTGIVTNSSSGDIVIRNSAGGNTVANFSPAGGANFAPIQTPSTATNPLANIAF